MTVINVPAGQRVHLYQGTVTDQLIVYCVGQAPDDYADFGISIYNQPPPYTWHRLVAGNTVTFDVDGFEAWVGNAGPTRIQLLFGELDDEGVSADEVEGASAHAGLT